MATRNQYLAGMLIAMMVVALVLYFKLTIPSGGQIKSIGVKAYWDEAETQEVTNIDWGMIASGESKEVNIWLKNTGNIPINMTLETQSWNPSNAGDYLNITWNYNGQIIQTGNKILVTFTLSASGNIPFLAFSNEIVITARSID